MDPNGSRVSGWWWFRYELVKEDEDWLIRATTKHTMEAPASKKGVGTRVTAGHSSAREAEEVAEEEQQGADSMLEP